MQKISFLLIEIHAFNERTDAYTVGLPSFDEDDSGGVLTHEEEREQGEIDPDDSVMNMYLVWALTGIQHPDDPNELVGKRLKIPRMG